MSARTLTLRLLAGAALISAAGSAFADPLKRVDLDDGWQVRIDPSDKEAVAKHPGAVGWFKATVPGSVQQDLMASGQVPDPFQGTNEGAIQWAGLTNWQFRRTLNVTPEMLRRDHVELVFEGLDTFATVRVNGQELLRTDNAHRHWRVDVKPLLKAGDNELLVSFESPIEKLQPMVLAQENPLPGEYDSAFGDEPKGKQTSPYIRKPKYQYGWDWGPRIVNIGLWQPVRLEAWDEARLDGVRVDQEALNDSEARLVAHASVRAGKSGEARVRVTVTGPDGRSVRSERKLELAAGDNAVSLPLSVKNPQRWWPAGYGAQPLYKVAVSLSADDGSSDAKAEKIGLRTTELIRKDGSFGLKINGVPIFAKGANLIPFDNFPSRVSEAQMRQIVQSARDANMNMIRVWGGGYYLDDRFYDLADELGIMVWQDFMFGGAVTPPDADFRHNVAVEAAQQVERLQPHPSIVLWAGNNEVLSGWENWSDRKAFKKRVGADEQERIGVGMAVLFDRVLRDAVIEHSPGVPYWPGSPSTDYEGPVDTDKDGDRHFWDVWSGSKPVENYLDSCPRFMSEYGFQAMPDLSTIRRFAGDGPLAIDSPVLKAHQKFLAGEGNERLQLYLDQRLRKPGDFADLVYLTQVNQMQAIGMAARHHRACRPTTLGSLYWQLNDTWPAISWASIDYYGQWKLLQYGARRFFAPQIVVAEHADAKTRIALVSDATTPMAATWDVRGFAMDGTPLGSKGGDVTLAPLSSTDIAMIDDATLFGNAPANASYAVAELKIGGKTVSRQVIERLLPKDMAYPAPGLSAEWQGKSVTITARSLARAVMLDFGKIAAQPSDDGFDLLPGESVRVTVQSDADAQALQKALTLRTLAGAR
ncbi:beta-mannosidase [Stakelama pacifica]|uniref:Beta-mannosidase B n=1 Tax=Stakelama pacifica TaxID=517720 RepID=A0A4R6FG58_9SPHN|nr:glycoside hydrolase family 2 protein [Stakelama pacifica]TDN80316.1 beta-mannosidase [Stakelama pacifica]GGO97960.1 beta-mannosidase [Stakelama pacifica]